MQELNFVRGEDNFIESLSPENNYGVVFEDDGETGYFYAVEKDKEGHGLKVLDALHIYEVDAEEKDGNTLEDDVKGGPGVGADGAAAADVRKAGTDAADAKGAAAAGSHAGAKPSSRLLIVWAKDWLKCALVLDGYCHAIFDFKAQGGYNINEFPPPNEIWTKGERRLTDDLVRGLF